MYQHIIDQWAIGNPAPRDLWQTHNVFTGKFALCETPTYKQIAVKGEPITQSCADKVRVYHTIEQLEPVTVTVVIGIDEDGNAVTRQEEVIPESQINPITYSHPELAYDDDHHCDMCGSWEENAIFRIGDGWYCKRERVVDNATGELGTCFTQRIKQLGGIQQ